MALGVEGERGAATFRAEKLLCGEVASNWAGKFKVGEETTSIQIFLKVGLQAHLHREAAKQRLKEVSSHMHHIITVALQLISI